MEWGFNTPPSLNILLMNKQNFYDLNFDQLKNFLIEKAKVDEKKQRCEHSKCLMLFIKKT